MSEMRSLSGLLLAAGLAVPPGAGAVAVTGLRMDSRQVREGDGFIALRGSAKDGLSFAMDAVQRGAAVVIADASEAKNLKDSLGIPVVFLPDLRKNVGPLFDAWYGFPSRKLEAFGVTGTNGKSTTTLLMTGILRAAGRKVISLGTIRYELGDEVLGPDLTTPSTDAFFELLDRGVRKGCDALAMEVSSHALSQDRVRGVRFKRALFTNLTQDHLDFHADFEDYFAAKKKLFTEYLTDDGVGIVNLDAPYGVRLLTDWKGARLTFSRGETPEGKKADVVLRSQELSLTGTRLTLAHQGREFEIRSPLIGSLNVENLLAASAFGLSLNLSPEIIATGIAGVTAPGRNEVFSLPNGSFAVVDYAHTPDALERAPNSLRPLASGRLWCVFGCGGNRDRTKRPLMGGIAERLADRVVLTNDNPRNEAPVEILAEIRRGMTRPDEAFLMEDRRAAIRHALGALARGDCLLIAGKGHENYQITGPARTHFSDQEEIGKWLQERGV